jgi:hypothetical protein
MIVVLKNANVKNVNANVDARNVLALAKNVLVERGNGNLNNADEKN